jgi:hypothetical protein
MRRDYANQEISVIDKSLSGERQQSGLKRE